MHWWVASAGVAARCKAWHSAIRASRTWLLELSLCQVDLRQVFSSSQRHKLGVRAEKEALLHQGRREPKPRDGGRKHYGQAYTAALRDSESRATHRIWLWVWHRWALDSRPWTEASSSTKSSRSAQKSKSAPPPISPIDQAHQAARTQKMRAATQICS